MEIRYIRITHNAANGFEAVTVGSTRPVTTSVVQFYPFMTRNHMPKVGDYCRCQMIENNLIERLRIVREDEVPIYPVYPICWEVA